MPRSANLLENALWSNALPPSSIRRMAYARLDARPEFLPLPGSQGSFDFASSPTFGTSCSIASLKRSSSLRRERRCHTFLSVSRSCKGLVRLG
jgi:hypothetical protein